MKTPSLALHALLEEHLHLLPDDSSAALRPFLEGVSKALCERIELRRVADERLRLSEQKYRGIIEGLDIGIIETDLAGKVKKVYNSFTAITGYTEEELLGKHPKDVFLAPGLEERVAEVHAARERGEAGVWEAQIRHKSGRPMNLMISGAPIRELDGSISGSIGLHFDITAHVERERELREAQERAEAALKTQEVFLANVSHELRTPLNAILGITQILMQKANVSEAAYLEMIKSSSDELLRIINDLLDIARINSGQFSLDRSEVNLNALIDRSYHMMSVAAKEKSVSLNYTVDDALKERLFRTDPVRLNQIITNLVSNAVKFTEPGGRIELNAEFVGDERLFVAVTDSGVGIDESKLEAIFESFRQEDDSVTRKYGGTGLGLSITRQLVELLGGELNVESTKGVGSTFRFSIPVECIEEQHDHDTASELTRFDGFSFLLVEDNEMNRIVARTIFEGWGAQVTEAENGHEAIELLRASTFDLVLMDLQMPELGGIDAVRKIRLELKSLVPIIALTANALPRERQECLRAGMDAYVSKPLDQAVLNTTIERVLCGYSDAEFSEPEQQWQSFLSDLEPTKRQAFKENLHYSLELALPKIRLAFENKDMNDLAQILHSIRPVVTYAGAIALARQIGFVELAAGQRRDLAALKCCEVLFAELDQLTADLSS